MPVAARAGAPITPPSAGRAVLVGDWDASANAIHRIAPHDPRLPVRFTGGDAASSLIVIHVFM